MTLGANYIVLKYLASVMGKWVSSQCSQMNGYLCLHRSQIPPPLSEEQPAYMAPNHPLSQSFYNKQHST